MIYVKWEEKSADIFIILMNVTNWTISGDDMSFVESQVSSMPWFSFKKKKERNVETFPIIYVFLQLHAYDIWNEFAQEGELDIVYRLL